MDESTAYIATAAEQMAATLLRWASDPMTLVQIALIAIGVPVCAYFARLVEPPLEARARLIKGNPDLLRVIVAFMRRLRWLFLIVWLWIAHLAVARAMFPEPAWLLSAALTLAVAWLLVSVLTRVIRNATLARTVAIAVWIYIALDVVGLDEPVMVALDNAAINLGALRISLLLVLKVIVVMVAMIWLAVFVGNVIANRVERASDLSPSFKVLIGKLIKIGLILIAGALALSATGVDLTALTVFSGAVGVGIGFGLQKVVSNFISGIIILLDKSIKPGDTISLGDTFGSIRDLRSRFVSVITRDGREYLIPNEDLITQQVVNWSFSSSYVRIDVEFGTSYDSDPHEVSRLAIETAKTVKRVSSHIAPVCWLTAFGASSLDFKLRFWISDPSGGLANVKGQVLLALWDAFKKAGIELPFPTREIILRQPKDATPAA